MSHYDFFQNRECEYFPCHKGINAERFNCLFCFCPLYVLADRCGGNYKYTDSGIKDCSDCLRPHLRENYDSICSGMQAVMELAKKKDISLENP